MNLDETETVDHKSSVCPFLGLIDDPETAQSFASPNNYCFQTKSALPVKLEFQRAYCLSNNYKTCDKYSSLHESPLPYSGRFRRRSKTNITLGKAALFILLLGFVIVVITWLIISRDQHPNRTNNQAPVTSIASDSTNIQTRASTISPSKVTDASTPTILVTATPTLVIATEIPNLNLPHALETPIGVEQKLIIHRAENGESLESIANRYWTTIEAIQAINYYLPSPLWVGTLVIVPVNQTDISGLPSFDAFEVNSDISVQALAQQLSVEPTLLELYNGIGSNESLKSGDWVIVPHMSTATP